MSKSVVERFTGIRGSGALHAMAALEAAGLIRKIPGNERRPSQVGLRLEPDWDWLRTEGGRVGGAERHGNPGSKSTQGSFPSGDVSTPGDRIIPASPGGIAEEESREAQEWALKEQAFGREYSTPEQQGAAIVQLCVGMPFSPGSAAARVFAIGRWYRDNQL